MQQLRCKVARVWAVKTVHIQPVLQGRCVRRSACHHLLKRLCKHSAIHTMMLHTYPKPSTLNAGPMCDSLNTKYILLPSSSDFVLLLKRASWFICAQYLNANPPSTHLLMCLLNWFSNGFPSVNKLNFHKSNSHLKNKNTSFRPDILSHWRWI